MTTTTLRPQQALALTDALRDAATSASGTLRSFDTPGVSDPKVAALVTEQQRSSHEALATLSESLATAHQAAREFAEHDEDYAPVLVGGTEDLSAPVVATTTIASAHEPWMPPAEPAPLMTDAGPAHSNAAGSQPPVFRTSPETPTAAALRLNAVDILDAAGPGEMRRDPEMQLSSFDASGSDSGGVTHTSAGSDAGLLSYRGYDLNEHVGAGAFPDNAPSASTQGVTLTPAAAESVNDFVDKASKTGIFKSITYEPAYGDSYGGLYDDVYADYGFTGEGYAGQFSVGTPVDIGPLTEADVTFERPVDGALSPEEMNAAMDEVLQRAGITDPVAVDKWKTTLDWIAQHESNYSPAAANGWDSNAIGATQVDGMPGQSSRGLMQTIPGTFAANHMAGTSTSIYDPVASIGAAVNYLKSRYGCDEYGNGLDEFYGNRYPTYHGY